MVGSGLAGASAAATLAELGYNVSCFCFQDSPRRAHSIAAQGGINAAKNYQNDGDSVFRLFYDTVKGGDFRARESNVYRLAEQSVNIIDQCVAQGVPFAREYGGQLDNRSFGGAQVSRTFYARGQTGQQLLLGAYQALERASSLTTVVFDKTGTITEGQPAVTDVVASIADDEVLRLAASVEEATQPVSRSVRTSKGESSIVSGGAGVGAVAGTTCVSPDGAKRRASANPAASRFE